MESNYWWTLLYHVQSGHDLAEKRSFIDRPVQGIPEIDKTLLYYRA